MAGGWHCRVGWPFINGLPAPCLCAQHRDPVPAVSSYRGPDHVITDWPISDHIIAYYV
ncbi:unnamed protein product [Staurois parvus]|uniref:Uncharacterized protein n=1 Tax=Staurois parvus TaxID=386267 RepID=A0ABN9FUG2_9NEOB|nr:unnamed protein product [Staurois parvus]